MHDISPSDCFRYDFPVDFGEGEAVGVDDGFEDGDLEVFQRVIRLLPLGIRITAGHESHVYARTFQTTEQGADGGADAIATQVGVVANYQDFHCCLFEGAVQRGCPIGPRMTKNPGL